MKESNKIYNRTPWVEEGALVKAKQIGKAQKLKKQLDVWYREQQLTIVRIQRSQERTYRSLLKVHKEKKKLQLERLRKVTDRHLVHSEQPENVENNDPDIPVIEINGDLAEVTADLGDIVDGTVPGSNQEQDEPKQDVTIERGDRENIDTATKGTTERITKHKVNSLLKSRRKGNDLIHPDISNVSPSGRRKSEEWLESHATLNHPKKLHTSSVENTSGIPQEKGNFTFSKHKVLPSITGGDSNKPQDDTTHLDPQRLSVKEAGDGVFLSALSKKPQRQRVAKYMVHKKVPGKITHELVAMPVIAEDDLFAASQSGKSQLNSGASSDNKPIGRKNTSSVNRDIDLSAEIDARKRPKENEYPESDGNAISKYDSSSSERMEQTMEPVVVTSSRDLLVLSHPPTSKSWHGQTEDGIKLPQIVRTSETSIKEALRLKRRADEIRKREILDSEELTTYHRLPDGKLVADSLPFRRSTFSLPTQRQNVIRHRLITSQAEAELNQKQKIDAFVKQLEVEIGMVISKATNIKQGIKTESAIEEKARQDTVWVPPPRTKKTKKKKYSFAEKIQTYAAAYKQELDLAEGMDPDSIEALKQCRYIRTSVLGTQKEAATTEPIGLTT